MPYHHRSRQWLSDVVRPHVAAYRALRAGSKSGAADRRHGRHGPGHGYPSSLRGPPRRRPTQSSKFLEITSMLEHPQGHEAEDPRQWFAVRTFKVRSDPRHPVHQIDYFFTQTPEEAQDLHEKLQKLVRVKRKAPTPLDITPLSAEEALILEQIIEEHPRIALQRAKKHGFFGSRVEPEGVYVSELIARRLRKKK